MAKLINSLKNLGAKLTGQEIESNKLVDVINETADNYEGGGGSAQIVEIDFNNNSSVTLTNEQKEALLDPANTIIYAKNCPEIQKSIYLYRVNDRVQGAVHHISFITSNYAKLKSSTSDWYGTLDQYNSNCKLEVYDSGATIISFGNDILYKMPVLSKQVFDNLYKVNQEALVINSPSQFIQVMGAGKVVDAWLLCQARILYGVETVDDQTEEVTSRQICQVFINNNDVTNEVVLYYFDNTGTRQAVDVTALDETHFLQVYMHFHPSDID